MSQFASVTRSRTERYTFSFHHLSPFTSNCALISQKLGDLIDGSDQCRQSAVAAHSSRQVREEKHVAHLFLFVNQEGFAFVVEKLHKVAQHDEEGRYRSRQSHEC